MSADGSSPPARNSGPRKRLGALAERAAAAYLERRGYHLLARNVHMRVGEIDLVMQKDGVTVFVEVRARHESDSGPTALESLTAAKQRRMRTAAEVYLALHPELAEYARIDLVAITFTARGLVRSIDVVENAVEGS